MGGGKRDVSEEERIRDFAREWAAVFPYLR
jgi:hypothetical protein